MRDHADTGGERLGLLTNIRAAPNTPTSTRAGPFVAAPYREFPLSLLAPIMSEVPIPMRPYVG